MDEFAMIKVTVTTASGILPIEGARVSVSYKAIPGSADSGKQSKITDGEGHTEVFKIPVKRARIGERLVDFPRRAECDVEICADGYVLRRARAVHLFPGITVSGCFDLIAQ